MAIHFPGESPDYRAARNALLEAEIDLRKHTERVAALRRALPMGGEIPEDYVFDEGGTRPRLSELFGDKRTLVLYSFMYGPHMEKPCPMCTSFLDGLDAQAHHLGERVALAVAARSPIARIREFARTRPWNRLRLLSCEGTTYARDYHGEDARDNQWPMMNVFAKKGGKVVHFWGTEMLYAAGEAGEDTRHIDAMWPLWNVLDVTPEGRGEKWYPKLAY
jgi:predicted dithiol-disulfide oxidoreductase (DUF899 family)